MTTGEQPEDGVDEPLPVGFWKSRKEGLANWKKVQPLGCRTITEKTKERSRKGLEAAWAVNRERRAEKAALHLLSKLRPEDRAVSAFSGSVGNGDCETAFERMNRTFQIVGESSAPWG